MELFFAADHAGFDLKQELMKRFLIAGYGVHDCGAFSYDAQDDYPSFCIAAAENVVVMDNALGIVIGGSGNGEQIAANKVKGARCALAWSVETAQLAREHNNAQLVALGARMHDVEESWLIAKAFVGAPWSAETRHSRRVAQILAYEDGKKDKKVGDFKLTERVTGIEPA